MPDRKITDHTELVQADFHNDDVVEIVDVSDTTDAASGTNKKTKWSTIKATLKAYFDTQYSNFSGNYSDLSGKPTLGTAAAQNVEAFATATQGGKADTAVQPGSLGAVATSNNYGDLNGLPNLSTLPTTGEKQALAGTNGTPSDTNPYVTNSDSRMSNSRTPTAHTHAIADVNLLQAALDSKASTSVADGTNPGLMSSSNFTKLGGIESGADVTDKDNVKAAIDAVTSKSSLVDADEIVILDSADSNNIKTILWSNVKTVLNGIYALKGLITGSGLTATAGKLIGRYTNSTGGLQEITLGSGLSLDDTTGVLSATGGGSKNWDLIQTINISGTPSSVGIAIAYSKVKIEFKAFYPVSNGAELRCRFSTNGGSSLKTGSTDYSFCIDYTGIYGPNRGETDHGKFSYTTRNNPEDGITGEMIIYNMNDATLRPSAINLGWNEKDYNSQLIRKINAGTILNLATLEAADWVEFYWGAGAIGGGQIKISRYID